MKTEIMNKASRLMNNVGLKVKKHSPEIFVTVGIAGTVASTVMACKATTKLSKILDETERTTDVIHKGMEEGHINGVDYSEDDGKKDLTIVYAQTGVKVAKLYAPAVALGVVSIGCIVWGHNILRKRNLALAAAYTVVDKGFKNYRKNVVERFGEEIDKELRYNIKAKAVDVETVDEDGNKVVKKEIVNTPVNPLDIYSPYARMWDNGNPGWTKDPSYNLMYLRQQQNWCNEKLKAKGHLFLNEVYDALGYPRTEIGQVMGWVYNNKDEYADGYVDFGIYDTDPGKRNADFVNGFERSVILDFNVEGPVFEMMKLK